jgi:hypothetical protein
MGLGFADCAVVPATDRPQTVIIRGEVPDRQGGPGGGHIGTFALEEALLNAE